MSQRNTFPFTVEEVARICDGRIDGRRQSAPVRGVSTDTRRLAPGQLFVALEGETHDGHNFLADAREAAAVVVSDAEAVPNGLTAILVDDTLRAYGLLAAAYRSRMPAKVAAVTGSTGKTTTKDMLGRILESAGPTVTAEGTHNNEVGVPLTLFRLTAQDRFCVLELAMRGPGEIDYLAEIAVPDVGIITNIGQSHMGRLGSREEIARVKAELLDHLPADGAAVLNADDFFFRVHAAMAPCEIISFGTSPEAHFQAGEIADGDLEGVTFELRSPLGKATVRMSVPGLHNVLDALAAAAAAAHLGADLELIVEALEGYEGSAMRMQRVRGVNGSTIINDAYNASPDSVEAALRVLGSAAGRKIFVFGDMLEMGSEGEAAHRRVGRMAVEAGIDWLIGVGELAEIAVEQARELGLRADVVEEADDVPTLVEPELTSDDLLLVKGSRGMALEHVVEALSDD